MPRPTQTRNIGGLWREDPTPGSAPTPVEFFNPPQGLNVYNPISRLGLSYSPAMKNFRVDDDWLVARPGTSAKGTTSSDPIVTIRRFVMSNSSEYFLRWTTTAVEVWDGVSAWNTLTGAALNLTEYSFVSSTIWNDRVVFSDGTSGMYEINLHDNTYAIIPGAPIARHITTLAGRIIASYIVSPVDGIIVTRIQWCVKNDNTNWSGLGSGYEDLLSSPGGVVDQQYQVLPINDTEALVIRSGSVWLMQSTGYFDVPFTFQFLYPFIQSDSWQGMTPIPGGVCLVGRDDVYILTTSQPIPVGQKVRDEMLTADNNLSGTQVAWNSQRQRVAIVIPKATPDGYSNVWHYDINSKIWTKDVYPFNIHTITFASHISQSPIDALTGTMDSLPFTYDLLGVTGPFRNLSFCTQGADGLVIEEDDNATGDVDGTGATVDMPVQICTGYANQNTTYRRVTILDTQFEYEAAESKTVLVEYSADGMATWSTYSTITCPATNGPSVEHGERVLERDHVQLRMTLADGIGFRFNGWLVDQIMGALIHP